MLTYLLIIFVIALALAPLAHFVPSKRQREVARMREYAAVNGLFVEFRSPPVVPGVSPEPGGPVIYYGRRLAGNRVERVSAGKWIRGEEGWRGVDRRSTVPPQLLNLPSDILAASVDRASCGVYWTEASGEPTVRHIEQVLAQWSEELLC